MISIRSSIAQRVLSYFFLNEKAKSYINELSRILEVDSGNLTRKLKELEAEGILISTTQGKERYYSLNKSYALLKQYKTLFQSKYGLIEELKSYFKTFKNIEAAYIFGSYASQKMEKESDIDILIIGNEKLISIMQHIPNFQKKYQREFNIIFITPVELEKKKTSKDPFITNIFANKMLKII